MGDVIRIYLAIGVVVSFGVFLLMLYGAIFHDEVRVTSLNSRLRTTLEFAATSLLVILLWPIALLTLKFRIERGGPDQ